jgi:hypothetical protein
MKIVKIPNNKKNFLNYLMCPVTREESVLLINKKRGNPLYNAKIPSFSTCLDQVRNILFQNILLKFTQTMFISFNHVIVMTKFVSQLLKKTTLFFNSGIKKFNLIPYSRFQILGIHLKQMSKLDL